MYCYFLIYSFFFYKQQVGKGDAEKRLPAWSLVMENAEQIASNHPSLNLEDTRNPAFKAKKQITRKVAK